MLLDGMTEFWFLIPGLKIEKISLLLSLNHLLFYNIFNEEN